MDKVSNLLYLIDRLTPNSKLILNMMYRIKRKILYKRKLISFRYIKEKLITMRMIQVAIKRMKLNPKEFQRKY